MPSRTLVVTLECAGQRQDGIQSARRRRKMGPGCREYRRSGRAFRSSRCSTARAYGQTRARLSSGEPTGEPWTVTQQPIRFERSLRLDQTSRGRSTARLRDERRAAARSARLPRASDCSRLVCRCVGQMAHGNRGHRSAVRRTLPDGQVSVRTRTGWSQSSANRLRCSACGP